MGDASGEETVDSDASQSESQENGDQEKERVNNPEFVAPVAHTDPSAQDEVLKMAYVMESLG